MMTISHGESGVPPDACGDGVVDAARCRACSSGYISTQTKNSMQSEGSFKQQGGGGSCSYCKAHAHRPRQKAYAGATCHRGSRTERPEFARESSSIATTACKANTHLESVCMAATTSASEPPPRTAAPMPSRFISAFSGKQTSEPR